VEVVDEDGEHRQRSQAVHTGHVRQALTAAVLLRHLQVEIVVHIKLLSAAQVALRIG